MAPGIQNKGGIQKEIKKLRLKYCEKTKKRSSGFLKDELRKKYRDFGIFFLEMTKKGRQKFCKMNWDRTNFFHLRASKNLVGPGHPRPSACHWMRELAYIALPA